MMSDLGIGLSNLTPDLARSLGLQQDVDGVAVVDVNPSSEAYTEAGLRRGMIITEANRQPVASVRDFQEVYADVEAGESFLVKVALPDQDGSMGTLITALTKPSNG